MTEKYVKKYFEPVIKNVKSYDLIEYRGTCKYCGYTEAIVFDKNEIRVSRRRMKRILKKSSPRIKVVEIDDFICEKCFLKEIDL